MPRPVYLPRPACSFAAVAFAAGVVVTPGYAPFDGARAQAAEIRRFGLAGSDSALWAYQRQTEPDGTVLLRYALRLAGRGADGSFRAHRMPPVEGGAAHAAVCGQDLHVFYRDGTHKRYTPGRVTWDRGVPAVQFTEVTLPQSAVPAAVACDATRGILYALVTVRQAHEIIAAAPQPEANADRDAPPEPVREPPALSSDHAVAAYVDGRWQVDRDGPPDLTLEANLLALLAADGGLFLMYRASDGAPRFVHRYSPSSRGAWGPPIALPLASMPAGCAAGWAGDVPVLLSAERAAEGCEIRALRFAENRWTAGESFSIPGRATPTFPSSVALAVFGGQGAVATVDEAQQLRVGLWRLEGGGPLEPPATVTPLLRRPPPLVSPQTSTLLQYLVLMAMLFGVFLWRRESVLVTAPAPERRMLAPLGRRAAAFLIDLTALFPVWGLLLYGLWLREGLAMADYLRDPAQVESGGFGWFLPMLGGIYGMYAAILERLTGSTLGKRAAGLYVVGHDGRPCGWGAALMRNATRVLEFYFPPLVLLVPMTPGRQRLGDIFARTVVVADMTGVPPNADAAGRAADGGDDADPPQDAAELSVVAAIRRSRAARAANLAGVTRAR
ncbi:MAG: RDD family protein [Planctomycetes bacterium]|nr:RDD family protein [Planctomycetota bacterium]